MRTPSCVIWSVIRKNNAYLVKSKKNGIELTSDPLSVTNHHKASDSGLANPHAVSISARKEKSKKTHNRVFDLKIRHNGHHSAKKTSGSLYATQTVKREVNRLAKVVNSLQNVSDAQRQKLLTRVYKLHTGNKLHLRKDAPAELFAKSGAQTTEAEGGF